MREKRNSLVVHGVFNRVDPTNNKNTQQGRVILLVSVKVRLRAPPILQKSGVVVHDADTGADNLLRWRRWNMIVCSSRLLSNIA